jgi:hypothetical protein
MDITPFVYPSVDQEGVALSPTVYALFDLALETGTITKYNCFLIKKTSEFSNNTVEPVDSNISIEKIELLSNNPHTGLDHGNDTDSGEQYRTKIVLEPKSILEPHTEYSAILSKEISGVTVFDPLPGGSNTGTIPLLKGPFSGLMNDTYDIEITSAGDHGSAEYKWSRQSDLFEQSGLTARKRYIEIDSGIFLNFPSGNYALGDTFAVTVKPIEKLNTTIAWDFSTGDSVYVTPEDERSDSVVDVPVNQPGDTVGTGGGFNLVSVSPYDGQSMVDVGAKGTAVINGTVVTTDNNTADLNVKRIKIIDLIGGAPSIYEVADDYFVEIEDGVTTNQEVVDLINGSSFKVSAVSATPAGLALLHVSGVQISNGRLGGFIEFIFSKNIDKNKFNETNIKAVGESLTSVSNGDLDFTYEITDNKLKIQF